MDNPLVSIIIPCYNRAHLISNTLESVKNQSYKNWECLVVDDGSDDDTVKVVEQFVQADQRFKLYHRPKDRKPGGNAARNFGFEVSQGQYINWFDSDDLMFVDFLEQKINVICRTTQLVISNYRYANYQLTRFRKSKFIKDEKSNLFLNYSMDEVELQINGCFWNREFLLNKNLFNENLKRFQDNDFHLRMLFHEPDREIIYNELATIRGGDGDKSQISSSFNLTRKKLEDVFQYRYMSIGLVNSFKTEDKAKVIRKIFKKTIWAYYEVFKFEKRFSSKIMFFNQSKSQLYTLFAIVKPSLKEKLKITVYLSKLIVFGGR